MKTEWGKGGIPFAPLLLKNKKVPFGTNMAQGNIAACAKNTGRATDYCSVALPAI